MTPEPFLLILRARYKVALATFVLIVLSTYIVSLQLPKQYASTTAVVIDV